MAITWSAWDYSGGNGMRVGVEIAQTTVTHTSSSITYTVTYYTENQYSYSDNQSVNFTGNITGSQAYTNSQGGGTIQRAQRTHTFNYSTYGTSPGTRTFGANIPYSYNGSTPSVSVTVDIPARPYGAPAAQTGVSSSWFNDSRITTSWTINATTGEPYTDQQIQIWDNVTNGWGTAVAYDNFHTAYNWDSLVANRRYQFRVRAKNTIDWSAWAYGNVVQTTPSAPTGAAVSAASTTSVNITWTNQANTQNGYAYSTLLEETSNGGSTWTQIATIASGTSSYVRSGLTPGTTYQYRVRANSTVGVTLNSGYSTTSSIQLMQAPAAPSAVAATYNSDTQATVTWTNNPTGSAPYTTLSIFRYDTASNTTVTVASGIAGTTTSFTDTGIVANNDYTWSIRAENAAGNSSATVSNGIVTTPAAPTNLTITRVSNGVQLTWTNNERTPNYTTNVRYYTNGSITDSSIIVAAGVTSYTLTGVSLTNTYAIGVRAKATDSNTIYSAWVDSATIAAAVAPNAPVSLSPNGTVIDLATSPAFTWQHVASVDGSAQTAFQVQHRVQGAGSWTQTGKITSATSSWTLPPGTYTNGTIVEWQVQTWGVAASAGPFSASATVTGSSTPTVSITSPTATLTTSTITASWNYGQAQSSPQASWIARLYDAAGVTLLEEISGTGTATTITFARAAQDTEVGQVKVQVQSSAGLLSTWASVNYTAAFTPPAASILSTTYDETAGATVLSLTATTAVPGTTLPASSVSIQRSQLIAPATDIAPATWSDWETIASGVAPNATLIDPTTHIVGEGRYRAVTYSTAPSSKAGAPIQSPIEDRFLYVNYGAYFAKSVRLWANIDLQTTASRDRALHQFAGRSKPVAFYGEGTDLLYDVTAILDDEASSSTDWESMSKEAGTVLLRDPTGRRIYGSISQVKIARLSDELSSIAFTVQEVSYP